MGFFKNLLRTAAPIVGGILGGPVGAAIGGGVAGLIGGGERAKGVERAGQAAVGPYTQAGAAALNQQSALLGLGGDQDAANIGYQNYLKSIGYQGQLQAGQQAITTSAAARGLLGSGSTAKALTRYGQQLGRESFGNYLGQLQGISGMGLQAAPIAFNAGTQASEARQSGWDQLLGGLGGAYDAWQAGRRPSSPQALDPQARITPSSGIQTTMQRPHIPLAQPARRLF